MDQTIDALGIKEPSHFLDLKILDPAVGTGVFLAEVLDQLTVRILAAMDSGDKLLDYRVKDISKRLRAKAKEHGIGIVHDEEAAIKIHIVSECLYGVDLDPIAVSIAQAVPLTRAFGRKYVMLRIEPRVRVGNALIGEVTGCLPFSSKDAWEQSHAAAYYGNEQVGSERARAWSEEKRVFHWFVEFPEVFDRATGWFPRSGWQSAVRDSVGKRVRLRRKTQRPSLYQENVSHMPRKNQHLPSHASSAV